MKSLMNSPAFRLMCEEAEATLIGDEATPGIPHYQRDAYRRQWWSHFAKPLPNVWLGVSVEDQQRANLRIPALLETRAAVHWLSCEPLLGPVDIRQALIPLGSQRGHGLTASYVHGGGCCDGLHGIGWVVAGGESGRDARPMHPRWARALRDQCTSAGVPFLFKQHGAWTEHQTLDHDARLSVWDKRVQYVHPVDGRTQGHGDWGLHDHLEGWAVVQNVGKKRAGRLLDGRAWDQYPTRSTTPAHERTTS